LNFLLTGPNKGTAKYTIYSKKNNSPNLPSDIDYIKKERIEEENRSVSPKEIAELTEDSYGYLVIGKLT